jgi:thiamine biosynthesis protein ThiS
MVTLLVNGDNMEFDGEISVSALLSKLEVVTGAIAVEVNRDIVSKSVYGEHLLRDGDQIEIVTFVGGG